MNLQFISDLHLTPERPDISRAFVSYMSHKAIEADALYILGDFFEYWLGDDAMEPFHYDIAQVLKDYTASGKFLYLMPGNRDFAIGKTFLKQTGAQWLNDPCTIEIQGETILLMHGDLLCTADEQYLKYRKVIRNPIIMALLRMTPLGYRKRLGKKIRSKSKKAKTQKSLEIMDVTTEEVVRVMTHYNVKTLIHGHTHRPYVHDVTLPSGSGQRYVLGDWDKKGWVITSDSTGLNMTSFNIN